MVELAKESNTKLYLSKNNLINETFSIRKTRLDEHINLKNSFHQIAENEYKGFKK